MSSFQIEIFPMMIDLPNAIGVDIGIILDIFDNGVVAP